MGTTSLNENPPQHPDFSATPVGTIRYLKIPRNLYLDIVRDFLNMQKGDSSLISKPLSPPRPPPRQQVKDEEEDEDTDFQDSSLEGNANRSKVPVDVMMTRLLPSPSDAALD